MAPNIGIPVFIVSASQETHCWLRDMAEDPAEAALNGPRADCEIIHEGEHSQAKKARGVDCRCVMASSHNTPGSWSVTGS